MSADGIRDEPPDRPESADEAEPGRDASRAPGLDRIHDARTPGPADGADRTAELRDENARLGRAVGELSSENAELYKRVGKLEAELTIEKARHTAWAKQIGARDAARAIREEAMAERLEHLERAHSERQDAQGHGTLPKRFEKDEASDSEKKTRQDQRGGRFSNENIAVGVAVSVEAAMVAGDMLGAVPAEAGGLITGGLGILAAFVAWSRKRGEERHADRP